MARVSKVKTESPGKYRLIYRITFPDGGFVYRSRRYKTYNVAHSMWPKSAELEEKTRRGTYTHRDIEQWRKQEFLNAEDIRKLGFNPEIKTLGTAIEEYQHSWSLSAKEAEARESRLEVIASILDSQMPLQNLHYSDGIKLKVELKGRGYKVATIQKYVQDLKRCISIQVSNQVITFNPFADLKGGRIPIEERIKPVRLNDEQVARVIEKAKNSTLLRGWIYVFLLFFFGCGLRRGEALKSRWENINWEERSLMLPAEITKTKKERKVGLGRRLYYELVLRRQDEGFILPKFAPWSVSRAVKQHLSECGFQGMRLHDTRHTYVSILQDKAGAKPIEAMARTGHANMRMLSHYSHGQFGKVFEDDFDFMKVPEENKEGKA